MKFKSTCFTNHFQIWLVKLFYISVIQTKSSNETSVANDEDVELSEAQLCDKKGESTSDLKGLVINSSLMDEEDKSRKDLHKDSGFGSQGFLTVDRLKV